LCKLQNSNDIFLQDWLLREKKRWATTSQSHQSSSNAITQLQLHTTPVADNESATQVQQLVLRLLLLGLWTLKRFLMNSCNHRVQWAEHPNHRPITKYLIWGHPAYIPPYHGMKIKYGLIFHQLQDRIMELSGVQDWQFVYILYLFLCFDKIFSNLLEFL
jgi:hypothetical protein